MPNTQPDASMNSGRLANETGHLMNHEPAQEVSAANATQIMSEIGIPCILLDARGKILAASNSLPLSFDALVGANAAQVYGLREPLNMDCGPTDCIYKGADGALVPAQLVPLRALTDGGLLVLVNDGKPFRQAEALRFDRTPYAVFRLDAEGTIRFANHRAWREMGDKDKNLIETPLASHFRETDESSIVDAIRRCSEMRDTDTSILVTLPSRNNATAHYNLVFTPDLAPNGDLLGVLAVLQSRPPEEIARDEIRRIALDPKIDGWESKLDLILEKIQPLVRFDHAVFGIYGRNVTLFRAIAVWPKGEKLWPARWMDLPETIQEFLDSRKTWVGDIERFIDIQKLERTNEVVRCYQNWGIKASVTLPINGPHGYSSALSLCSKEVDAYGEDDLKILRSLDLEPVLMRFEKAREVERIRFADELKSLVVEASSLNQVANDIITKLSSHFEWDHIALFRVNRLNHCFELVAQHNLNEEYSLSTNTLPMGETILDETLVKKNLLTDNAVVHDQLGYYPQGPKRVFHSAMTVPIHLSGRIRWILYVESGQSNTFKQPDTDELVAIRTFLEEGLNHHLLRQTKQSLMAETEQAVVFVGLEGGIIEMNQAAARMLGIKPDHGFDDQSPLPITSFALEDDLEAKSLLCSKSAVRRARLELRGPGGTPRSVLATRHDLDASLDMSIWFFTDIAEMEWSRDLRFLRETVAEIATQTRTSLAIACSLTTEMASLHEDAAEKERTKLATEAQKLGERVVAEINKADITFERLASATEDHRRTAVVFSPVSVSELLKKVIAAFPERDQRRIQLLETGVGVNANHAEMLGDPDALSAAFRSILAYLIRRRTDDAHINVAVSRAGNECSVLLELSVEPSLNNSQPTYAVPDDALVNAERTAHDDAGLAIRAIVQTIKEHGGELITIPPHDSSTTDSAPSYESILPPWNSFKMNFSTIAMEGERHETARRIS